MPYKDKEKKRQSTRESYLRNREEHNKRSQQRKGAVRRWLEEYKATLSCIDCGEDHPATLDFHHRDPSDKDHGVANMVRDCASVEKILAEIEKCDVLCSNCHRIRHWNETRNSPSFSG